MAGVTRIGHVGVIVSDLDRTIAFYRDVVGLRLSELLEYSGTSVGHGTTVRAAAFMRCDPTHHCLAFFALREPAASEPPEQAPGLHHIAFEMATPAELLAMYRTFRDRGLPIVEARRGGPGNQPRFYARDPDGNLLEFYWGIDQVGWDGVTRPYDPIQAVDLEAFDFEAHVRRREQDAARAGRQFPA